MDIGKFLEEVSALPGVPGHEAAVGARIAEWFRPLADEIFTDALENLYARVGQTGPRVLVCAHQDEIGLIVTKIEDDGCLRVFKNGGVDPRILPGMEVSVQARGGPIYGVVGAKPPHLLTEKEREKAISIDDCYIDAGYPAEQVRNLVRVGDMAVLLASPRMLAGDCMAGKTMDNRASVASMLAAAELMKSRNTPAETYFVATSQEEIGSKGAAAAAYRLEPDLAIVVDVTHAEGPGTGKWEAFPLDKLAIVHGPNIHPKLEELAHDVAKENGIPVSKEIASGVTWTDAESTQISRGGVPTLLLSIPLKYMHTTVELLKLDVVRETGRLIALLIERLAREWEGFRWY
ncbi:MAG: M42 family metallopeptidase [Clostridiales bacterium]|nr:M42 family metallopeptidase [Clostridiales bacterium]